MSGQPPPFVSRAGVKLAHALAAFGLDPSGWICADLGSNTGGFVDCLLRGGAARVYAIDTGYGALDYRLRQDPRVVVMERTNAMHATLPEPVDLVTIDVAWTRQRHILPAAKRMLKPSGRAVTLVKPHYEAPPELLKRGVLPPDQLALVLEQVRKDVEQAGFCEVLRTDSPILGAKGNRELLLCLRPARSLELTGK